jgi:hypothetical protein
LGISAATDARTHIRPRCEKRGNRPQVGLVRHGGPVAAQLFLAFSWGKSSNPTVDRPELLPGPAGKHNVPTWCTVRSRRRRVRPPPVTSPPGARPPPRARLGSDRYARRAPPPVKHFRAGAKEEAAFVSIFAYAGRTRAARRPPLREASGRLANPLRAVVGPVGAIAYFNTLMMLSATCTKQD